jgi:hypothetical protein
MKSGRIATAHNSQAGFYPYDIEYSIKNKAVNNDRFYHLRGTTTYTDSKKSVLSMWVKRTSPRAAYEFPWSWYNSAAYHGYIGFDTSERLRMVHIQNSSIAWDAVTTPIYRDTSQWMHLYFKIDSTVPEISIVVNGIPVTEFATYSPPSLNYTTCCLGSYTSWYVLINAYTLGLYHFDGYMADVHCFDGVIPPYTEFGEWKYNTWVPKEFTNITTYPYGNAGLRFDFSNAGNLSEDTSGNEISFTTNGSPSQSINTPTNNYPILDQTNKASTAAVGYGGLREYSGTAAHKGIYVNHMLPKTGKWGWQATVYGTAAVPGTGSYWQSIGISENGRPLTTAPNVTADGYYGWSDSGYWMEGGAQTQEVGASWVDGDELEFLYDADEGTLTVKRNGTAFTKVLSIPDGDWIPCNYTYDADVRNHTLDFGQDGYIPSEIGYKTLCTTNWPNSETSIINSEDGLWITLWTGDGSGDRDITGSPFNLSNNSLVWQKIRTQAYNHRLLDTERGPNNVINSNTTNVEASDSVHGWLDEFLTNGFSTVAGTTGNDNWNMNTEDYVAWVFNMLPAYGMDIVSYTRTAAAYDTVPHSLGVSPELVMGKVLDRDSDWRVGCQ